MLKGSGTDQRRIHHISQNASLRTILSTDRSHVSSSFVMDAVVEQAWQAPIFHKSRLLYLYCVDPDYVSELTVPSLPFLKIKCLFGHVSFPGFLSERRMVVFPKCKRVLDKMKEIDSPCVIEVTSSVEFQVRIANLIIHVSAVYFLTQTCAILTILERISDSPR